MIFYLKDIDGTYLDNMKAARNQLLTNSDWTQLADAQCDKESWAVYRQALRDFPATWEPSEFADFPVSPDYVETVETVVEETVETPVAEEPVVDDLVEGEQPQTEADNEQ
jgi:hypothetical protein